MPALGEKSSDEENDAQDQPRERVQVLIASAGRGRVPTRGARSLTLHVGDEQAEEPGSGGHPGGRSARGPAPRHRHRNDHRRAERERAKGDKPKGTGSSHDRPGPEPHASDPVPGLAPRGERVWGR